MLKFTEALDGARTLAFVDEIARDLWRAYGAGKISEPDAEAISAQIEEARRRIRSVDTGRGRARAPAVPLAAVSMFPPRRRSCVSPNRAASRARRRRLAFSGPLPPALAARFTVGQLAALRIVVDEFRARGSCELTLAEIAARAGVGVTTARNSIRLAAGDGLLVVVERRRHGRPSLPNVVKVISREWRAWIGRGRGGQPPKVQTPSDMNNLQKPRPSGTRMSPAKEWHQGRQDQRQHGQGYPSEPTRQRSEGVSQA